MVSRTDGSASVDIMSAEDILGGHTYLHPACSGLGTVSPPPPKASGWKKLLDDINAVPGKDLLELCGPQNHQLVEQLKRNIQPTGQGPGMQTLTAMP